MPNGQHRAKRASAPRAIGMIMFRILAVTAWLFALLFTIAGFQVNLPGDIIGVIIAAVLASVGLALWIIGDMVKDPEQFKKKQEEAAARNQATAAAKEPTGISRDTVRDDDLCGHSCSTPGYT